MGKKVLSKINDFLFYVLFYIYYFLKNTLFVIGEIWEKLKIKYNKK